MEPPGRWHNEAKLADSHAETARRVPACPGGVKNQKRLRAECEWYIRTMPIPVGVLGAGSFGTCLALLCARKHNVTIWARDGEIADAINREHRNPRYLTHAALPENVRATGAPSKRRWTTASW